VVVVEDVVEELSPAAPVVVVVELPPCPPDPALITTASSAEQLRPSSTKPGRATDIVSNTRFIRSSTFFDLAA